MINQSSARSESLSGKVAIVTGAVAESALRLPRHSWRVAPVFSPLIFRAMIFLRAVNPIARIDSGLT